MARLSEFLPLAFRLLLSVVFLLAGTAKFLDPAGSMRAWRDFGLPKLLARPMVVLLPLVELAVAVILIPAGLAWYGACGALGLLAVFIFAIAMANLRGRKPDCHCFGQLHSEPAGWPAIVRNLVLAACAGWLVSRGTSRQGPELLAWLDTLSTFESKVALVAACLVGFLLLRTILGASRPQKKAEEEEESGLSFPFFGAEEAEEAPPQPVRPAAVPAAALRSEPAPAAAASTGPLNLGLPIGTAAPEFELPTAAGGTCSLQSLRAESKPVLLIFSSPVCDSCHALAGNLPRWVSEMAEAPTIVFLSRGAVQDNLARLPGFEPKRILLQREFEVAAAYDCDTTPAGVVVGPDGVIRSELALGGLAIRQLLKRATDGSERAADAPPSLPRP